MGKAGREFLPVYVYLWFLIFQCNNIYLACIQSFPCNLSDQIGTGMYFRFLPVFSLLEKRDRFITENNILRQMAMRESIDRKSTRLNSSHVAISYAVFCLKKK